MNPGIVKVAPSVIGRLMMLVIFLLACTQDSVFAQRYEIERAQTAVREKILRELGGNFVSFPEYPRAETYYISSSQTGVRGQGAYRRDNYSQTQNFSYEAVVNTRNGRVDRITYQLDDEGWGNAPSWLVGTFRGRSPVTRQRVTVTIQAAGNVSAVYDDRRQDTGRVSGNTIRFDSSQVWDVSDSGGGFRARSNFRTESFERTAGGDTGACVVPRWTVGRFRGRTSSGDTELIIQDDGSATARSLTTNRSFSGRYLEGIVTFEFGSFSIARDGDGIRTIAVANPNEQTVYNRTRY